MSEANRALVRRFWEEVVNGRSVDTIDELFASDCLHHDPALPPELLRGRENYKQVARMFLAAYPDLHGTIEDMVAEGDRVMTRLTWRGTHRGELMGIPPSGKPVNFGMISIHRIAGSKVAEGWVNFDALGMLQQIGAVPMPAQATA